MEFKVHLYNRPPARSVQQTLGETPEIRWHRQGAVQTKRSVRDFPCLLAAVHLLLRAEAHSDRPHVLLADRARLAHLLHVLE